MPDANMPPLSLKGNLSSSPAPAQDVLLATVAASGNPLGDTIATTVAIARADIPSRTIPLNAFRVVGYTIPGDGGEGAVYIRGTGPSDPGAIQDASSQWWKIDVTVRGLDARWFGNVQTTVDIAANKAVVLLPSGTVTLSASIVVGSGKITCLRGVRGEMTRLVPAAGTTFDALVKLVGAAVVTLEDMTIDTRGFPTQCLNIDKLSQRIDVKNVSFVSDIGARVSGGGDMVYNEGDTTFFYNCYWYGRSSLTWCLNWSKDAQSSISFFPAGNNHLVLGGNVYGDNGGTPGQGCNGFRVTQYNIGALTVTQRKARRVEGVTILGVRFVTDGPRNVQIGNSLYVQVASCICDQSSLITIEVTDGADCYAINDNYIGSAAPAGRKGVYVSPTAGLNGAIDSNQFVNLDSPILVDATGTGASGNGLSVSNNKFWLVGQIAMVLDSVIDATISGNIDYRYDGVNSLWVKNSYRSPILTIANNRLSPGAPATFDGAGDYRGSGNSGWWSWLGAMDRGVRLGCTGQSIPHATKTKITAWNVERNTDAGWNVSTSQIIIPAWCNLARFEFFGVWASNSTGARSLAITDAFNNDFAADDRVASGTARACVSTGLTSVAPGSVWTVQATQTSGGALILGGITHATVEFCRSAA